MVSTDIQRTNSTQQQTALIPPQFAEQINGSVGVVAEAIDFTSPTEAILIENTHATQTLTLFLQIRAGVYNAVGKEIVAGGVLPINLRTSQIRLVGSGANTTYEILATLE